MEKNYDISMKSDRYCIHRGQHITEIGTIWSLVFYADIAAVFNNV